jgi:hypothetical protein
VHLKINPRALLLRESAFQGSGNFVSSKENWEIARMLVPKLV